MSDNIRANDMKRVIVMCAGSGGREEDDYYFHLDLIRLEGAFGKLDPNSSRKLYGNIQQAESNISRVCEYFRNKNDPMLERDMTKFNQLCDGDQMCNSITESINQISYEKKTVVLYFTGHGNKLGIALSKNNINGEDFNMNVERVARIIRDLSANTTHIILMLIFCSSYDFSILLKQQLGTLNNTKVTIIADTNQNSGPDYWKSLNVRSERNIPSCVATLFGQHFLEFLASITTDENLEIRSLIQRESKFYTDLEERILASTSFGSDSSFQFVDKQYIENLEEQPQPSITRQRTRTRNTQRG